MIIKLLDLSFLVCHIAMCISQHRQGYAAGTKNPDISVAKHSKIVLHPHIIAQCSLSGPWPMLHAVTPEPRLLPS